MSTRKTTLFYVVLIAVASMAIGMGIASRMGLSPESSAQQGPLPAVNSAPLAGPVDATTFRNIARAQTPMVVNIRTEQKRRAQELTEFFGGEEMFRRCFGEDFFGPGDGPGPIPVTQPSASDLREGMQPKIPHKRSCISGSISHLATSQA